MIIDLGCDDAAGQLRALAERKQDAETGVLEKKTLRSGRRI